jgi:RNA recognition motif-containing protein
VTSIRGIDLIFVAFMQRESVIEVTLVHLGMSCPSRMIWQSRISRIGVYDQELAIGSSVLTLFLFIDRYMGKNDPVAKKILSTTAAGAGLAAPEDKTITSLFLSALSPSTDESQIRTFFIQSVPTLKADAIRSITMVPTSKCAFVNFSNRSAAESAAERCAFKMDLDGTEIRVAWGRSRPASKGRPQESVQ